MSLTLFIRTPPSQGQLAPETCVQWGVFKEKEAHCTLQESLLCELNNHLEESITEPIENTVVLLSGRVALYRQPTINASQRKHLQPALPYLLEDELAEEISELHFASTLPKEGRTLPIVVIRKDKMECLLDLLAQQSISPDRIVAESNLMSENQEGVVLWVEGSSTLLSRPNQAPVSLETAAVTIALQTATDAKQDEISKTLTLFFSKATNDDTSIAALQQTLAQTGWCIDSVCHHNSIFEHRVAQFHAMSEQRLVNLRSGAYANPDNTRSRSNRIKWLTTLAACWFLLQSVLMLGEGWYFQRQSKALWQETAQRYLEMFPRDQQMLAAVASRPGSVDIKSRLSSRLQATPEAFTPRFLPLLAQLSEASESFEQRQFQPRQIRFDHQTQQLQLTFDADTMETVDHLITSLKSKGLQGQLDSADQGETGVVARLAMGGSS